MTGGHDDRETGTGGRDRKAEVFEDILRGKQEEDGRK